MHMHMHMRMHGYVHVHMHAHMHMHMHMHIHMHMCHVPCACHRAHRATGPVLGHNAEVGISTGARILLEGVRQVELPVLRALAQRLRRSASKCK